MTDRELKNKYRKILTHDVEVRVGEGWRSLVEGALEAIMLHCTIHPGLKTKVSCIKEKFGGLRIYAHPVDNYLNGVLTVVSEASLKTCDKCGKYGKLLRSGYAMVRCEECKDASI